MIAVPVFESDTSGPPTAAILETSIQISNQQHVEASRCKPERFRKPTACRFDFSHLRQNQKSAYHVGMLPAASYTMECVRPPEGKTRAMHSAPYPKRICVWAPAPRSAGGRLEVPSYTQETLLPRRYPENAENMIGFYPKAPELKAPREESNAPGFDI